MLYKTITDKNGDALATLSVFHPADAVRLPDATRAAEETTPRNSVCEYQLIIRITKTGRSFDRQLKTLFGLFREIRENELRPATLTFLRIFLSDAANQLKPLSDYLPEHKNNISIVEQPPLDGSKIALWAYLQTGMETSANPSSSGLYTLRHGEYLHLWTGTATSKRSGETQHRMRALLNSYKRQLREHHCTLAENCIRTWIYVRDIDLNYAAIVKARRELFARNGLTEKTHYIASTGISGRYADSKTGILFDAYAVQGIRPEQIRYLHAATHLNPTHEYGVTFERGTCVRYGDRRHVFISGTASIDNRGKILHRGNLGKQTARMIENVGALLGEADCGFDNVAQMIVYLRDPADYSTLRNALERQFPAIPTIIVLAAVCRPGWLVEMECFAVAENHDNRFAPL
jgi:enamine deaminase RidA (YjgF/YER057c/UK114 family)